MFNHVDILNDNCIILLNFHFVIYYGEKRAICIKSLVIKLSHNVGVFPQEINVTFVRTVSKENCLCLKKIPFLNL